MDAKAFFFRPRNFLLTMITRNFKTPWQQREEIMGSYYLIDPVTRLLDPYPANPDEAEKLLSNRQKRWEERRSRYLGELIQTVIGNMRLLTKATSPIVKKVAPPPPPKPRRVWVYLSQTRRQSTRMPYRRQVAGCRA